MDCNNSMMIDGKLVAPDPDQLPDRVAKVLADNFTCQELTKIKDFWWNSEWMGVTKAALKQRIHTTDKQEQQFRCTRQAPYGPGCPGFTDKTARQGYYITAKNEDEALTKMKEKFPNESIFSFTADPFELFGKG